MFNIMDILKGISAGRPLDSDLIRGAGGDPTVVGGGGEIPSPPVPTMPPGTPEVPATPAMPTPTPEAYKSPPDLVAMYTKLMQRAQTADAIRRGATMIAAGITPYQSNREALLRLVDSGGSSGAGGMGMEQLIQLQKMQAAEAEKASRSAMLPALMERYGLDEATVRYLDANDQLDEVIFELNKPHTQVVDTPRSGKILIDTRDGSTIRTLAPSEPRKTEYRVNEDGTRTLVYEDDKSPVAGATPIGADPATAKVIEETKRIPAQEKRADDTLELAKKEAARQERETVLHEKEFAKGKIEVRDMANGQKQAFKDGVPFGDPVGPETDLSTEDMKEYTRINEEQLAAGKPFIPLKDWILMRTRAGTEAGNADIAGVDYGDPPKGQAWKRDPKTHTVVTDEDGAPISVWIKNSPEYAQYQREQKKAADDAAEAAAKLKKGEAETEQAHDDALEAQRRDYVKKTIHVGAIDRSIDSLKKHGSWVGGWGALLASLPETEAGALAGDLDTIKTGIAFDELESMRRNSPTGAALGNVTVFEDQMLRGVMGSLRQSQKSEVTIRNLKIIRAGIEMITNGVYDPSYTNKKGQHFREPTEAEVQAVLSEVELPEEGETKDIGNYKVTKTPIKK